MVPETRSGPPQPFGPQDPSRPRVGESGVITPTSNRWPRILHWLEAEMWPFGPVIRVLLLNGGVDVWYGDSDPVHKPWGQFKTTFPV